MVGDTLATVVVIVGSLVIMQWELYWGDPAITLAIAVHNVPEGLAISLVLVPQGYSVFWAAIWSIVSSLPQPIMAVPAFAFVEAFRPILPAGLGFAAGAMIWMAFSEILPDALEDASPGSVATAVTIAVGAMVVFQALLSH